MDIQRDSMEYNVVIVGAGPAGLAAACRLKQLAATAGREISVCVLEKGASVGAHNISGAVIEPRALNELFPDWRERGAPLNVPVSHDEFHLLRDAKTSFKWPRTLLPKTLHNEGNYIISLGNLCRWLGDQATALGVEIYPGFAAQEVLIDDGRVRGVITGDLGIGRDGRPVEGRYTPGIELRATWTLFAEGCRGHLGKRLQDQFHLRDGVEPQHYAIGLKEIWQIDPAQHVPGLVLHGAGWPLDHDSHGGFFLYHGENQQISVGLIIDLNYRNPYLSPFEEFQRLKQHPLLCRYLEGGTRIAYGARAISKGGLHALPKMIFPGGALIGCELGTLDGSKIKGIHTAMKSGMLAAEAVIEQHNANVLLDSYPQRLRSSWLYEDLYRARNFSAAIHRYGTYAGGAFNFVDQNLCAGRLPFTLRDPVPDHASLKPAANSQKIEYPKPDGRISFDRPSSVWLASTVHAEDQPDHLTLIDPAVPMRDNLPRFDEPAQRYCPAGVYEVTAESNGEPKFRINASNCIHCKVCDIKDPSQNIVWIAPEGGSGPNYPDM